MSGARGNGVKQILQDDPWYTDDQITNQLGNPATRNTIESRWQIFAEVVASIGQSHARPVRILDAGCGDGINLVGLHEVARNSGTEAEITACDYNPLRVSRARELRLARVVELCALHEMPFQDESFDLVLCNHVLEHVTDLGPALDKLRQVVAASGVLIINVPNEGCSLAWLRNNVLQRFLLRQTDHVHFFNRRTLDENLRAAKLDVIGWRRCGFFYPHTRLNTFMKSGGCRLALTRILGRSFPSQSADLIALARRFGAQQPLCAASSLISM